MIYVAGPIGKGPVMHKNVLEAIDYAHRIRELGGVPQVPHLCFYWNIVHPRHYEDWMQYDFEVIKRCDALFRMPGHSPGSDREVRFTERIMHLPWFDDLDQLAAFIQRWKAEAERSRAAL